MSEHMTAAEYQAMLNSQTKARKAKARPLWKGFTPPADRVVAQAHTSEISFPFATPSLNTTKSEHWKKKTIRRKRYESYIFAANLTPHMGRVRLEVYRHSTRTLDYDNFFGGGKDLVDAFKNLGIIKDDTTDIIAESHYEQVRVLKREQAMTVVRIIDLPETN